MKNFKLIIRFIVLFLFTLTVLLLCGKYLSDFLKIEKELLITTITISGTIFVSIFSLIIHKIYENQKIIEKERIERKIPVYENIIKFYFRVLFGVKMGAEPLTENEIMQFFSDFTPELISWASDDVLLTFRSLKMEASDQSSIKENPFKILGIFEKFLFEIRKDLGHENVRFKDGTLLGLFVNDIDKNLDKLK